MKSYIFTKIYFITLIVFYCNCNTSRVINVCKKLSYLKFGSKIVFHSSIPAGGLNKRKYVIHHNISGNQCVLVCCDHAKCNLSLYNRELKSCYTFYCDVNTFDRCLPVKRHEKKFRNYTLYLLRFPENVNLEGLSLSTFNNTGNSSTIGTTSSAGVTSTHSSTTATKPVSTSLDIDIGKNITIYLPNDSVTLTATVRSNKSAKYEYEWEIVTKPPDKNVGTLEGKNTRILKLTHLILGEYQFKVAVHGSSNSFGNAFVHVFVKPAIKKNEPPVAVIKPKFQTVTLPNNIILDGSGSTDDDKIVSYHWETVQSPITMEKRPFDDRPMLQLDKNIIAGNYTFKLIVKDAQGQTSFDNATLTVLPEKDYPPKSDPGPNTIINLPVNSVILNGSGSTDDKKIVSYEWIKVSDSLTADIQGVREPILKLSNLQEGTYTFNLKVTDSIGQTSEKEVKVFVKPRVNIAPTAKASVTGDKQVTVRLPATEATLNGSLSSDDDKIVKYQWEQTLGQKLNLVDGDKPVAYVNDLKVGVFKFNLTVWDNEKQKNSDEVTLRVDENQNQKPKATVIPENKIFYLQPNLVRIDGSKSWDDHKIVKYRWFREDDSLAAGDILEKSDSESVLLLGGLLPGIYKFKLMVYDEEGSSDSAFSTLEVFPSVLEQYFIQLQFTCSISTFTESKKNTFLSNIQLILQKKIDSDSSRVRINLVKMETVPFLNTISMVFYATQHQKELSSNVVATKPSAGKRSPEIPNSVGSMSTNPKPVPKVINIPALTVLEALNEVKHDTIALTYPLIRIDTYVCQNNCSGHGHCNPMTKLCECKRFWTNSLIRDRFGDGRPNCDWSIIYLIIFFCFVVFCLLVFIWILVWIRRRKCKSKKISKIRKHKYMRLNDYDSKNKFDQSSKLPKSLTNGVKSRSNPDKEMNNFPDTDSNLSSDGEETMFINNRNTILTPQPPVPVLNGQAIKNH